MARERYIRNTYEIKNSRGNVITTIAEDTTDRTTTLVLHGRGVSPYGLERNENYVHLLENFSNTTPPPRAIDGQLWWRRGNPTPQGSLYVYDPDFVGSPGWRAVVPASTGVGFFVRGGDGVGTTPSDGLPAGSPLAVTLYLRAGQGVTFTTGGADVDPDVAVAYFKYSTEWVHPTTTVSNNFILNPGGSPPADIDQIHDVGANEPDPIVIPYWDHLFQNSLYSQNKFYWECQIINYGTANDGFGPVIGVGEVTDLDINPPSQIDTRVVAYDRNPGRINTGGSPSTIYGVNAVFGDVVNFALDYLNQKVWIGINGVWQGPGTQDPATGQGGYWPIDFGTNAEVTGGTSYVPQFTPFAVLQEFPTGNHGQIRWRFTRDSWTSPAPTGFNRQFFMHQTGPVGLDGGSPVTEEWTAGVESGTIAQLRANRQIEKGLKIIRSRDSITSGYWTFNQGYNTGKYYAEMTKFGTNTDVGEQIGITTIYPHNASLLGTSSYVERFGMDYAGTIRGWGVDNANPGPYLTTNTYVGDLDARAGNTAGPGDTMMIAADFDNKRVYFGMNGTWFAGQDPTNPTHGADISLTGGSPNDLWHLAAYGDQSRTTDYINTGGALFRFDPPTGYQGWSGDVPSTGDFLSADPTGINHDNLENFVANEHIDHSAVIVETGQGFVGTSFDLTAGTKNIDVGGGRGITVIGPGSLGIDNTVVLRTSSNQTITGQKTFTSPIRRWLGYATSATPAFAFDGDSNTGWYRSNGNTLSFATGATHRLRIESNGVLRAIPSNYETLVTNVNDIPNKKYTDDVVGTGSNPTTNTHIGTSSISGLNGDCTYLVHVYGRTTNKGTGIATLESIVLRRGSTSPGSGTVVASTPSQSINWFDGNTCTGATFICDMNSDTSINAKIDASNNASYMTAIQITDPPPIASPIVSSGVIELDNTDGSIAWGGFIGGGCYPVCIWDGLASFQFTNAGVAQKAGGDTTSFLSYAPIGDDWLISGSASDFEIKAETFFQSGGTSYIGTTGSWLSLGTTRTWTVVRDGNWIGLADWILDITIRDKVNPANQVTGQITMTVFNEP